MEEKAVAKETVITVARAPSLAKFRRIAPLFLCQLILDQSFFTFSRGMAPASRKTALPYISVSAM